MTTITNNKLTDEKIKIRINEIEDRRSASRDFWDGDYEYPEDIELLALREVLERRKASKEPVRYLNKFSGTCVTLEQQPNAADDVAVYIPLYAAPPAQVVPEEIPKGLAGQIVSLLAHNIGDKFLAQKIWNACRNAILNGDTFRENSISSTNNFREIAETSTNSPVIPDGYALVPIEPTEEMLQASYRESSVYSPSAYRAMIAAAPQQEVE